MSAGLDRLGPKVADWLSERGVTAVTAFPALPRQERSEPVAVVTLRGCKVVPAGFENYLGERYNPGTGRWVEQYGRKAQLTFGLDLYAPERGAGEDLQTAFDTLAGALLLEGPEGLELEELSCGQTVRDGESRRLKRPVEAVFAAYLNAVRETDGEFTEFELRGVAKT